MRILSWLLPACLALSACNMAVSGHPIFCNEPSSTIRLKDGLWAVDDADCHVNTKRPVQRWPKCAGWLVVSDNRLVGGKDSVPNPVELVIAGGKPPILEFPWDDPEKKTRAYFYLALEPGPTDSSGDTTDFQGWTVACGIQQPSDTLEPKIQHFPGMNDDCNPESVEALRGAAAAGPQGTDKKAQWRWIRAGAN